MRHLALVRTLHCLPISARESSDSPRCQNKGYKSLYANLCKTLHFQFSSLITALHPVNPPVTYTQARGVYVFVCTYLVYVHFTHCSWLFSLCLLNESTCGHTIFLDPFSRINGIVTYSAQIQCSYF